MKTKINYLIIIICCCGLANAGLSLANNCAGLFFAPIAETLHVNIGETSMYLTITTLMTGFCGVSAVKICHKYNVRIVLTICAIISTISYLLLSRITATWQLYLLAIITGSVNAFYGMSVISVIIGNWFHKKMGLATGIAFSFSGIGSSALSIILSNFIESLGWRSTYVIVAWILFFSILPAILLLRMLPSEKGMVPFGYDTETQISPENDALQASEKPLRLREDKIFWVLCLIPAFAAFITGFGTHLSGFGSSIGLTASVSALMLSASMLGNTSSKLIMGILCDMFGAKSALKIMFGSASLGLLMAILFSSKGNQFVLLLAAFFIGMSFSICGVGMSNMTKEIYGPKNFGRIYAALAVPIAIGGASSYSIIGFSYDYFGSYYPIGYVCVALGLLSILCVEIIYKINVHNS